MMRKTLCFISAVLIFLIQLFSVQQSTYGASESVNLDQLYIEIGDALMNAKDEEWDSVKRNISLVSTQWNEIRDSDNEKAQMVDEKLESLRIELQKTEGNSNTINDLLSSLSKALAAYDKELNPVDKEKEKEKIKLLLPLLSQVEGTIQANELDKAQRNYQQFLTDWTSNEVIVRKQSVAAYGEIETQIAFLRIALSQTPPDKQKALTSVRELRTAFENFIAGKDSKLEKDGTYTLATLIQLLENSMTALKTENTEEAGDNLNQVLLIWPSVEGEVRTKDPGLYNRVENDIPVAASLLSSEDKDIDQAQSIIEKLTTQLKLISSKTSYSFLDAMFILLREGLEALLIITGLIAFLKKTNHGDKQIWIWNGAIAGIIASAALAICMNVFFSNITAASSREYLEGIIGIVAVIMMLTVGMWLHKKTNIHHWNTFIRENLGKALAKGSIFSMALLSFLSIFREGAETIIFYAGMAPSMKTNQLVLGIGIACMLLLILGFVIIRYSTIIPMRPFFLVATLLIYLLAFKILGVSIHALQVANTLPIHSLNKIPFIEWIGFYPTLETIIPQLILLLVVLSTSLYVKNATRLQARTQ